MNTFHNQQPTVPLTLPCLWAGVSRSWLYARPASLVPSNEATALRDAIEKIVLELPGYGYRRVTAELSDQGFAVNHKRVLRIMQEESLLCVLKRRWVITTDSDHGLRVYPNLLRGSQSVSVSGLNQVWVADITYIRLPTGFCYRAAILDAFSRRVIGWHLSRFIDSDLVLAALDKALQLRHPEAGLVHHSDRGVQYACREYMERLLQVEAQISMSRKATPRDNAKAESFFKTLKSEEVYLQEYRTFEEAASSLTRFIEDVYNQKRLHSALGYRPPTEFEQFLSQINSTEPQTPAG